MQTAAADKINYPIDFNPEPQSERLNWLDLSHTAHKSTSTTRGSLDADPSIAQARPP